MSDFTLCLLVFPIEMSQVCITELPEIFQGKKSHGDISWQLIGGQITSINSDHCVILVELRITDVVAL